MKTVIINRKTWGTSNLRNIDGTRCCLGFCLESYGVKKSNTLHVGMPIGLSVRKSKLPKWLFDTDYDADVREASNINDNCHLTWEEKEEKLKPIFAKHNIRLVFRGKR